MGTGKSSLSYYVSILVETRHFTILMLYSFHLMVSAYITYTNGLLQLFGSNINSVELAPTPTPGPTTTPGGGGGGGNATG